MTTPVGVVACAPRYRLRNPSMSEFGLASKWRPLCIRTKLPPLPAPLWVPICFTGAGATSPPVQGDLPVPISIARFGLHRR